jgi:acid phosphatase type 7
MQPSKRTTQRRWQPWLCGAVAIACQGVSANEQGDLAAEKTGDLSQALAPRRVPDAELVARCGDGSLTEAGSVELVRRPFVQQVTAQGATVVFQGAKPRGVQVRVTTFEGALVADVTSAADPSVPAGTQQSARFEALESGTGYCYELVGLTTAAGFRTAPATEAAGTVRFVALGDSGSGNSDQLALRDQLEAVPFDFIVHTGDLAYGGGSFAQLERTVFQVYSPLLRSIPLYPVTGNHDYETEDASPFFSSFLLPENGDVALPERYYSFDWGNVHLVGLDTERIGTAQATWLDEDLRKNRLPWTVVFGHRPPFSSGEHGSNDDFRRHFVPVLERHEVALVLNGHDHDYERSKPLNGVTYVVTGGGGIGTRPVGSSDFTAFSEAVIHFLLVEVTERQLLLHAIDGTGREFDQVLMKHSLGS